MQKKIKKFLQKIWKYQKSSVTLHHNSNGNTPP